MSSLPSVVRINASPDFKGGPSSDHRASKAHFPAFGKTCHRASKGSQDYLLMASGKEGERTDRSVPGRERGRCSARSRAAEPCSSSSPGCFTFQSYFSVRPFDRSFPSPTSPARTTSELISSSRKVWEERRGMDHAAASISYRDRIYERPCSFCAHCGQSLSQSARVSSQPISWVKSEWAVCGWELHS